MLARRYGLTDSEQARNSGYQSPGPDQLNRPQTAEPDSAAARALYGEVVSRADVVDSAGDVLGVVEIRDGCLGEANRTVFGGDAAFVEFTSVRLQLDLLVADAWAEANANDQMIALNSRWSSCMSSAGFSNYENPIEAQDQGWRESQDSPSILEIETAVADVACKNEVSYVSRALEIEAAAEAGRLDEFDEPYRRYTDLVDDAFTR